MANGYGQKDCPVANALDVIGEKWTLLVLRDLLGHSTVLTTEKYLRKLDTTRIYREAYERSGLGDGQATDAEAEREADAEFADAPDGSRD